jgi:hypothetical protein
MNLLYKLLDIFFMVFHTALILFNLFGWIFKSLRKWNLITLLLTAGSWVFLGFFYGFGYCPLTDWHFNVIEKLGEVVLHSSYIQYLLERLTGLVIPAKLVDTLTLWGLVIALVVSVGLNIRDVMRRKYILRE